MKKIILHVGMHKTGTTTIQNQLAEAKVALLEGGYLYPSIANTGSNHSIPLYSLYCESPANYHINIRAGRCDDKKINDYHNEIRASLLNIAEQHWETLIISGEDISVLSTERLEFLKIDFKKVFGVVDFTVICSLRSPLDYWRSSVVELIKNGFEHNGLLSKLGARGHYKRLCEKLELTFGKENVIYYKFEESVKAGNITQYFLNLVENTNSKLKIAFSNKYHNEACSQESFYLLKSINDKKPLIIDGKINPRRSIDDLAAIVNMSGSKCIEVGLNIESELDEDLNYLHRHLGFTWEESNYQNTELWSESYLLNLKQITSTLNEIMLSDIVDAVRDIALIEFYGKDNVVALRMLRFCQEIRPNGPLIAEKINNIILNRT